MNSISKACTKEKVLQEGIMGCIVAASYVHGHPSPEDYDRMIDTIVGRDLFLDTDVIKLLRNQLALRYLLDEEEFLEASCAKVTEDWKMAVFTIAYHLISDSHVSTKSTLFLKKLKEGLGLKDVKPIIEVLQLLHKNKIAEKVLHI